MEPVLPNKFIASIHRFLQDDPKFMAFFCFDLSARARRCIATPCLAALCEGLTWFLEYVCR